MNHINPSILQTEDLPVQLSSIREYYNRRFRRFFSPTHNPVSPRKTASTTIKGLFAVTLFLRDRLIGVFKNKEITIDNQNIKIMKPSKAAIKKQIKMLEIASWPLKNKSNIMKTQIITLFTALVLITGMTTTTFAAPAKYNVVTTLKEVSPISKIEVRGNVELYISDGAADEVKVYNKYYTESARVQTVNGVLQIASYKAEKLIVWVTAADLRSVSVYDNAAVKSFGKLSKIEFSVDLHDNASAKLDMDAYSAEVTVTDHAKADLSGSATEFKLNNGVTTSVNKYNFAAAHFTENKTFIPAPEMDELVGI